MASNLTITIQNLEENQDYQIVTFNGDFDKAGHMDIKETLDALVKSFAGKFLIFDFAQLKFINSEAIGYMMEIHAHLAQRGRQLVLLNLRANITDIFKAIGLTEIIKVYNDLNAFLNR